MSEATFRAYVATQTDGAVERELTEMPLSALGTDGVLIEVEYSSVNYKDGLACSADGKVARISPIIPGIDLAGTVIADGTPEFPEGAQVIAHGYDIIDDAALWDFVVNRVPRLLEQVQHY
jgi:NADPH:quinone reductase-like Zn-dependent oxidoreductase